MFACEDPRVIQDQIHNELGQLIVNPFCSYVVFHISDLLTSKEKTERVTQGKEIRTASLISWHMLLATTST